MARNVKRWVDTIEFPVWAVVHTGYAEKLGHSNAMHSLRGEGGEDLVLFTSKDMALTYIANYPLEGHETYCIDNAVDLKITLESARIKGATHVRIDDTDGRTPGIFCPEISSFISALDAG